MIKTTGRAGPLVFALFTLAWAPAGNAQTAEELQRLHEGDVALGVCAARVTVLINFYESLAQAGATGLADALSSLRSSEAILRSEAQRRASEDGVDTSLRVMNEQSGSLWDDISNATAQGDAAAQQAHDKLYADVRECLGVFFAG